MKKRIISMIYRIYACISCGTICNKNDEFCNNCGGTIIEPDE